MCAEYHNPVGIITKGVLIERDLDVLQTELARAMEPYVAPPKRRLQTIERLTAAGIDVAVSVAPIIPGLNDEDIAKVLGAAREAGAKRAHYTLLRLPGPVKEVFEERLRNTLPLRAERVLHRIRETRGGELSDSRVNHRMRGEGVYAQTIERLFEAAARKVGIRMSMMTEAAPTPFRRPPRPSAQLNLF